MSDVQFNRCQVERLEAVCASLGTTPATFLKNATMRAVAEVEQFDEAQLRRLAVVLQSLQTSGPEFVTFAVMQAVDEVEGYARDAYEIHRWYQSRNTPVTNGVQRGA